MMLAGLRAEPEPKKWIDAVADDEFPLSVFYTQLQPKLAPALITPGVPA